MRVVIIISLLLWSFQVLMAQDDNKTALLLVDIQDFYFPGGSVELVEAEQAALKAAQVLNLFRQNQLIIVHIKHKAKVGHEINELVKPNASEKIFEKEEVNAFKGTDLKAYLENNQVKHLVICGMQTHMCLEAAARAAADYGFQVTVISNACATRDLQYNGLIIPALQVHCSTLVTLKSYAEVISFEVFEKKFLN